MVGSTPPTGARDMKIVVRGRGMLTLLIMVVLGGILMWWYAARDRSQVGFSSETKKAEHNNYRNLVLDSSLDCGPKQYVEPLCNTCNEPIKCGIKVVDISRGTKQILRVDVDPTEMDLHKEIAHATGLRS